MRIICSGPHGWNTLAKTHKHQLEAIRDWMETQLEIALLESRGNLVAATSLGHGLEMVFTSLCLMKEIPYEVIARSPDSVKSYDHEIKALTQRLLDGAQKVTYTISSRFQDDPVIKWMEAINNWVSEERNGRVLIIKRKQGLSKSQKIRMALPNTTSRVFNLSGKE